MKERGALLGMLAIVGIRCAGIKDIATIVVISAENRSFDSLYGSFPGANGLSQVTRPAHAARSRRLRAEGTSPVWGGLTAKGVVPAANQAQTEHFPKAPFCNRRTEGSRHAARRFDGCT
jgi:phospholipase C